MSEKVNSNIEKEILVKRNVNKQRLINRLKRAEQQIKTGEVTDGDVVLASMKEKYGF